jgi:hypothetical protein
MSHRRSRAVVVLAIALACAGSAHAGERPAVAVLESGDQVPTGELVTALRVHLDATVEVEMGPRVRGGAVADRFGHASSLVQSGGAVLVVWIERMASSGEAHNDYIVYAVGRDPSRALVEVVRIAADGRAETVRVMALKVASLVDLVLSTPERDPSVDVARPFASHAVARRRSTASYTPRIEVGLLGTARAGDVGAQGGIVFAAGLERTAADLALSVHAGARWLSGMQGKNELGAVEVDEVDVALGLRASTRWRDYAVGVDLGLGARLLDASAVAADGRAARATSLVPAVGAGIHGEVGLGRQLDLRLYAGMETAEFRQRFLVLHRPAADLGRFRAVGGLSLIWTWR